MTTVLIVCFYEWQYVMYTKQIRIRFKLYGVNKTTFFLLS